MFPFVLVMVLSGTIAQFGGSLDGHMMPGVVMGPVREVRYHLGRSCPSWRGVDYGTVAESLTVVDARGYPFTLGLGCGDATNERGGK